MFSLFYGLPATYWDAFASLTRPPLLMDLFQRYGYQLGLFSSVPCTARPPSIERPWPACRTFAWRRFRPTPDPPGGTGPDRRMAGVARPARPGPSLFRVPLLRLGPGHRDSGKLPLGRAGPTGSAETGALHARYLTAVHYVDSLVGRVFDDLKRRKLLDRTVVIVTSDHGMEFNENGPGFTGHGTAFSDLQMRTLLVVRWPGRAPARVSRRTSHNDVAPTLPHGGVRLHESALRLLERPQPLLRRAVGLAHRGQL